MKNLELPLQSEGHDLRFEVEDPSVAESHDTSMSYGLNLRQSTSRGDVNTDPDTELGNKAESNGGIGVERPRFANVENALLQKLKEDLERLPEDRGFEEFDDVPVEGFGAALLAGYGWVEGRGIGKKHKEDVKVVQYEKRTAKEGLGFVPSKDSDRDRDGKEKNKDRKNEESHFVAGKDVRIVGGRDMGSRGRIVKVLADDMIVLNLSRSGDEVEVPVRNIAELGSKEEEDCLRKLKDLKIPESKHEKSSNRESRDRKVEELRKHSSRSREEGRRGSQRKEERTNQISWLASHIRVRVISKDLKGGRLYLKKGKVVDVVGPRVCDISMDESRELIQGVGQELLQTAVPRRGGPVLVLYGKHKGVYGNLVERDMEKEIGVVEDADSRALHTVSLEQIAEYIGDPSYIGY